MFSFKNWNKPTPANISLFIKSITAVPVVAAYITAHNEIAIAIAVIGALVDTFYGPKKDDTNSNS